MVSRQDPEDRFEEVPSSFVPLLNVATMNNSSSPFQFSTVLLIGILRMGGQNQLEAQVMTPSLRTFQTFGSSGSPAYLRAKMVSISAK